jgi:hypothetical protein
VDNAPHYNWNTAEPLEEVAELPREEVLVRLHEFQARYDGANHLDGVRCPLSVRDAADGLSVPHRLRYGCCRDRAREVAA